MRLAYGSIEQDLKEIFVIEVTCSGICMAIPVTCTRVRSKMLQRSFLTIDCKNFNDLRP